MVINMYGTFEYGSIPYGDAVTSILIVITRDEISFIFVSGGKTFEFISPRKKGLFLSEQISRDIVTAKKGFNEFASELRRTTFISEKKQFYFISKRKSLLFSSPKEG